MATMNPFDLLGDDDNDDPSQLIAKLPAPKAQPPAQSKQQVAAQPKPAKLPSKPLPPAQAVREAKNEAARGGGRGGGRAYGRGRGGPGVAGGGYRRDFSNDENPFSNSAVPVGQGAPEDGDANSVRRGYGAPRGPYRGGRRGSFSNGVGGDEHPRRVYERHSGTGRGNEFKREGSGRGNWGIQTDEISQVNEEAINESEKNLGDEKPAGEEDAAEGNKENPTGEPAEKEPEEKEMTLEEYQKVLEEKRKALKALKSEERKVDMKEFESMQQLSNKKENVDVFIKLGSDKDKRKEAADKEEKSKKSVSINEFLKPAEGERYYNPGSRGHGRGRSSRGGYGGGSGMSNVAAPSIEDPGQFPTLGAK